MEKFLGVLFCGGRGKRLGKITEYVSKPLLPVYDKPAFMFGLELLERAELLHDILILSNNDNDRLLKKAGYPTLIQNDSQVRDMFTGWEFIKRSTGTGAHGVLMPSDNICNASVDTLIRKFIRQRSDFLFSITKSVPEAKLLQMGNFDPVKNRFAYKPKSPYSYGVIAPFIVRNNIKPGKDRKLFESERSHYVTYNGYWKDIGDHESLADAAIWRRKKVRQS